MPFTTIILFCEQSCNKENDYIHIMYAYLFFLKLLGILYSVFNKIPPTTYLLFLNVCPLIIKVPTKVIWLLFFQSYFIIISIWIVLSILDIALVSVSLIAPSYICRLISYYKDCMEEIALKRKGRALIAWENL